VDVSVLRILIADDHAIVRAGLKQILAEAPETAFVGEAKDGVQAIHMVVHQDWDIIVLDMRAILLAFERAWYGVLQFIDQGCQLVLQSVGLAGGQLQDLWSLVVGEVVDVAQVGRNRAGQLPVAPGTHESASSCPILAARARTG
jgi:DNA-binding NarL/FixJ family response regulator